MDTQIDRQTHKYTERQTDRHDQNITYPHTRVVNISVRSFPSVSRLIYDMTKSCQRKTQNRSIIQCNEPFNRSNGQVSAS